MEEWKDLYKSLDRYLKSEENLKNCEPFEQLNQKYILLQKQYGNSFNELFKDIEKQVHKREYAKGGEVFHRGFYSPSYSDLIIGNANRGRLVKKPPKNSNYYEYLFDVRGELICVYQYCNINGVNRLATIELFVRQQNEILSLEFDADDYGLSFISECYYENGRLLRYENALCQLYYGGKGCSEINVEAFEYEGDLMHSFRLYQYIPPNLLKQNKITFTRDEEGYLSTFTMEQIGGFKPKTKFDREQVIYKVSGKRI